MNRMFARLLWILCGLYALLLAVGVMLMLVLLAISGIGYDDLRAGRDAWWAGGAIVYLALMTLGLPACIGLLSRSLSGGRAALRAASPWMWRAAAGTLFATVLLLVGSLVAVYAPGEGQSAEFEFFVFSMLLYPLGIVFPFLSSSRRDPKRVGG